MPAKDIHVAQARHDRQFWTSHHIATTRFRDWVVTGIFYEAVHWVEAFLATKGDHPLNHGERNLAIARYADLDPIAVDYDVLKVESENARYTAFSPSADDVQGDADLVEGIEAHVMPLL